MAHLHLSPADVTEVRRVLMIDDRDFDARMRQLLDALHRLIPSDALGVGIADRTGLLEFHLELPHPPLDLGHRVCGGSLHVGIEQLVGSRCASVERDWLAALGVRDCLRVGFSLGEGRVAQIHFDRHTRLFEPRHVELLSMLQPALARQVRPPGRTLVVGNLSGAERQVLDLVAAGASNQDVADQLCVSEGTVRKHLEHIYRKLGVTNRTAAAALVRVAV